MFKKCWKKFGAKKFMKNVEKFLELKKFEKIPELEKNY